MTRVFGWRSVRYGEVGIALSRTVAPFHGCKRRGTEAMVTTVAVQAPCTNWIDLPNNDICQAITTFSVKTAKLQRKFFPWMLTYKVPWHFVMLYKSWKLISTNQVFEFTSKYEILNASLWPILYKPWKHIWPLPTIVWNRLTYSNEMHEYTRYSVHSVYR
jgi:hypothetical protein